MNKIPPHLVSYSSLAARWGDESVQEVDFSAASYQIAVKDPEQTDLLWVFIQLGDRDQWQEGFCPCLACEQTQACVHLLIGWNYLWGKEAVPLHRHFLHSLWNVLGNSWFEEYGEHLPRKRGGSYQIGQWRAAATPRLLELINHFTDQEPPGRYEDSFWAALAKQLMVHGEIQFPDAPKGELKLAIGGGEIITYPSRRVWDRLIPFGPWPVHGAFVDLVEGMEWKKNHLHLTLKKLSKKKGERFGAWLYVEEEGFYPAQTPEFLAKTVFTDEEVGPWIDTFQSLLPTAYLQEVNYQIYFDRSWVLHILPYVETPGDLQGPYGYWYYHKDRFVHVPADLPLRVEPEEIPHFLTFYRPFFSRQKGFEIYSSSKELQVEVQLDKQGGITWKQHVCGRGRKHIFGSWEYIEGEGFFSLTDKKSSKISFNQKVPKARVAWFLESYQADLTTFPGLFLEENPFENLGLQVLWNGQKAVISPLWELKPLYAKQRVELYAHWVYVESFGFYRLQEPLPEGFSEEVHIKQVRSFLLYKLPALMPWVRFLDHPLIEPQRVVFVLHTLERKGMSAWHIEGYIQTEYGQLPMQAFFGKEVDLFTQAGYFDLRKPRWKWISLCRASFSTLQMIRLQLLEEVRVSASLEQSWKALLTLTTEEVFEPKGLKSHLRAYQEIGAKWLFSLSRHQLGALLCDEMGLGKTHQAMALFAALRTFEPKARFLVVCPTSVLFHWEEVLSTFLPDLGVHLFHGSLRQIPEDYDILLTSYGVLLRSSIEESFAVACFDELQVAKNPKSKIHKTLIALKARVKIGLTGTPLENYTKDVMALLQVTVPGYLTGMDFHQLPKLLRPFMLRRTKADVLPELPPKTEEKAWCEMHPDQWALYQKVLMDQRPLFEAGAPPPSAMHIFALLTCLKQICDHPALYLRKLDEYKKFHSGKWDLFVELLDEAADQKVVVYSQYLGMLDIIEQYLQEQGIGYASLRGATRDRQGAVKRFAQDPHCRVFVASLRAAGLGIDLTAGSVVIHYDRWWNPAREQQATDRVHRLGQKRGVQVFTLLTKNSFEERIDEILRNKQHLFSQTIAVDDKQLLKALTYEELVQLFF